MPQTEEVPAVVTDEIASSYWFPWFDNTAANTTDVLEIANPGSSAACW